MDEDGYPKRAWDKRTGEIDHEVTDYWRENYDLRHILQRDWATLGPRLVGKLHIYAGDMDNYYLNNAVYLTEEFLESTTDPYYDGFVDYGDRAEHCWNGDHDVSNAAVVTIRPPTGEILAMVGSLDYWDESISAQLPIAP